MQMKEHVLTPRYDKLRANGRVGHHRFLPMRPKLTRGLHNTPLSGISRWQSDLAVDLFLSDPSPDVSP